MNKQLDLLTGEVNEELIDINLREECQEICIGLMNNCKKASPSCQYNKSACITLEIKL